MLTDCPFLIYDNSGLRPILPVKISNPHTNKHIKAWGLIDTGADECAIPAGYASLLGHDLLKGTPKTINTGNGVTNAYSHTTTFELYDPRDNKVIYTINDTPIDFMPNLSVLLLGVKSFLSNFILKIDYPNMVFSVTIQGK